jgi:predicted DCC family thiol-disulfide oxidoreductase YuxK
MPDDFGPEPIAFMDRDCALCSFGARMIHRLDRSGEIRICPAQSPLGQSVLAQHDMALDDPDSWIFVEDGVAHFDFDAVIRVGARVGGFGRLLLILRVIPRGPRNRLYRLIARNRYRWFGKGDFCALPDPSFRARLIE